MITFDRVLKWIEQEKHFTYSRFGDGELNAIFNKNGQNCDGHIYYPELGKALKKIILKNPTYFMGLQKLGDEKYRDSEEWMKLRARVRWHDMEIFTKASRSGRMKEFADLLRAKNVVQVGNANLRSLGLTNRFIEVPVLNCWDQRENIVREIFREVKKGDIIIYSSGMPSKVFIDHFYSLFGNSITQIDCGSVWDYYTGINSRSYMNNLNVNKEI